MCGEGTLVVLRIDLILILPLLLQDLSVLPYSFSKETVIRRIDENFSWSLQSLLDFRIVIPKAKARSPRKYAEDSSKHK